MRWKGDYFRHAPILGYTLLTIFAANILSVVNKSGQRFARLGREEMEKSLAVAAKDVGERVCVIDLDPQASLLSWSKTRNQPDIGVIPATAGKLPALLKELAKKGITLAIVDTPGADGAASIAAMREADLNIMLNQCPPAQQTARVDNAVEALEEMGGLISPLVLARVDYQEAARHGLGVTEINPNGAAAQEMRQLWSSIKRRLARGKSAPSARAA